MQVRVIGRHMALSSDQTAHAEAEAAKLARFFDGINDISVTFDREHDDLRAEMICVVSGGGTLVAVETGRTVQEAVDLVSDNMARQIKRYKEKLHRRRMQAAPEQEEEEEETEEAEEAEEPKEE